MGRIVIPGVVEMKGILYFRRRVTMPDGRRKPHYHRLPAITDPGFAAALARARGEAVGQRPAKPETGSIGALCHLFRAELASRRNRRGKALSKVTIANYRRYADRIEADHGHELVRALTTKDCIEIREAMADTPGVANNYMAVLRDMVGLACRKGWLSYNPVREIKPLPLGEHEPWPQGVITAALAAASPMTRLALVTYLCSGQRGGDIIRIRHNWHDGRIMQFQQGKTGKITAFPMHTLWLDEIAKVPMRAVTILYDRSGRPFQSLATLRERINDVLDKPEVQTAIDAAIDNGELPPGAILHPHGLRKNAACYLSEAGAGDDDIGILIGMSPDMVRHYTKRVRARVVAERMADSMGGVYRMPPPGLTQKGGSK